MTFWEDRPNNGLSDGEHAKDIAGRRSAPGYSDGTNETLGVNSVGRSARHVRVKDQMTDMLRLSNSVCTFEWVASRWVRF
jgi:hypothetical protein